MGPGLLSMEPGVSLGMECKRHAVHLGVLLWMGVAYCHPEPQHLPSLCTGAREVMELLSWALPVCCPSGS